MIILSPRTYCPLGCAGLGQRPTAGLTPYSNPPVNRPCMVPLESFIPTISSVFPSA